MPRFSGGIQYAVTSRSNARISGVLDCPAEPDNDI
jgi:hypothetical protein